MCYVTLKRNQKVTKFELKTRVCNAWKNKNSQAFRNDFH